MPGQGFAASQTAANRCLAKASAANRCLAKASGLPIGNLTSQWFGNLYLDETDHWIEEVRRAPGYTRYMDDLVVWSDSKAWLWALWALADDLAEPARPL